MRLVNIKEIESISGGLDSISATCYDYVNLYSSWWYYGLITSETFTDTFTNNCSPDTIVVVDSEQLDVIACVPEGYVIPVLSSCYS